MPSPFPGMDPYLEEPHLWPDVHARLITGVADALTPALRPKYVARIEQDIFRAESDDEEEPTIVPDVRVEPRRSPAVVGGGTATMPEVTPAVDVTGWVRPVLRHRYLEVREPRSRDVVTCIELVSPANKRGGSAGRRRFGERRDQATAAGVNWLEIDLLRAGKPTTRLPMRRRPHYYAFSDHADPNGDEAGRSQSAWPFSIRDPMPVVAVPLRPGERPVPLELKAALEAAYDQADYDADVDHAADPPPPALGDEDAAWLDGLLREAGRRRRE